MKLRIALSTSLLLALAMVAFPQRPRNVASDPDKDKTTPAPTVASGPAPITVKAKYEGGVFGYKKKMEGTLTFDDVNNRLLFRNDKQKEILFIPYDAVTSAYADTESVRPAAATVASNVPYIGLPAGLIKTKVQYLTLQYSDPDSSASGVTSFKLENKEILASVLNALATKAGLTPRGQIFVKKK
jgi:hypothetical protein